MKLYTPLGAVPPPARLHFLITGFFLLAGALSAQGPTGSIVGTATDNTGAVIPGVEVTAIHLATNETRTVDTGPAGTYRLMSLPPGRYRLQAEAKGFKRFLREPILLEVQQTARIDLPLQVGDVSETVEVTASTPLLEPETSSLGEVIGKRKIEDLPLNGRNTFALIALVPGVIPGGGALDNPAVPNFYAWSNFQVGGALGNQSEFTLDGASIHAALMNTVRFVPTQDSVEEFKVQTNNLSAEYGRTAGGIITVTTKSGTNEFHGTAFEFLRNKSLNTNAFFNNANRISRPAFTQNQFGGTLGGPIIPDKLFFFGSYEGMRLRKGLSLLYTVPTASQLQGDFSDTRDSRGNLIPIYDATTTRRESSGAVSRTAFPGNVIPGSRFDKVAQSLAPTLFAPPTQQGAPFTRIQNFATNASQGADSDQVNSRVDYIFNEKQRLFGRYSYWKSPILAVEPYKNGRWVEPNDNRRTHQFLIEDLYSFSPTLFADFRYSLLDFDYDRTPPTSGLDLTTLGFPSALNSAIESFNRHTPTIRIAGFNWLSGGGVIVQAEKTHQFTANLTKVANRHTYKAGVDIRVLRLGYSQSNDPSGDYSFTAPFTARNPFDASTGGSALASFLLGYGAGDGAGGPGTGTITTPAFLNQQKIYRGVYFQDDYRVNRRLTLNMGLRYDQDGGLTESEDRQSNWSPHLPNPLAQRTGLPLVGKLVLVNSPERQTRQWQDTYKKQFAPRFGFAYSLNDRTVLRGGYGIFFLPTSIARRENLSEATSTGTSLWISTLDGGLTPFATLSNPFPDGLTLPPGRNVEALDGQSFSSTFSSAETGGEYAYSQQWNFNVQRELPGSALIDLAYAGLKSNRLPFYFDEQNQLSEDALALGSSLTTQVPNPFFGLIDRGGLANPTVALGQLLRPFPQYTGIRLRGTFRGNSSYHAMQFKFQKRFQGGAGLLVAYTASKLISDTETQTLWLDNTSLPQNFHDLSREKALSSVDVPQRLVVSGTLDLPFGRGRRYGANTGGIGGKLISGWAANGIFTAQAGTPLSLTMAANRTGSLGGVAPQRPNSTGLSAYLSGAAQGRLGRWFDTSAFAAPPAFTYGNLSRNLPDMRTHGINNIDLSVFKNTTFGPEQRLNLQFRAEFYNLLNRVRFGRPGEALGNPQFGVISSQANEPRLIQLALKLIF